MSQLQNNIAKAVGLANIALFAYLVVVIFRSIHQLPIPFDTDEADHANASIELFRALRPFSIHNFIDAVTRQAFYPPLFSFFGAASYTIFGPSFFSSRVPSVVFFVLTGALLSFAVWKDLRHDSSPWRYIFCFAPLIFLASSPLLVGNSALCMLELCGVAFTSLIFIIKSPSERTFGGITAISIICLLVLFTKYNFGLLVIPGIIFAYIASPFCRFSRKKRDWYHAGIVCVIVIVSFVIWALASSPESVIRFFIGHKSYSPLLGSENLLFEIRAWFFDYSVSPWEAAGTLIFALIGAWYYKELFSVRAAYFITAWSFFVLLLSTTNEARHIIVAAPCIWYLATLGIYHIVTKSELRTLRYGVIAAFVALYIPTINQILKTPFRVAKMMEGKPSFAKLQDDILNEIDPRTPVLFLGVTDNFSIETLRWQGARVGNIPYTEVRFDSFPYEYSTNSAAKKRNPDYPYITSDFPKDPVESVLDQKYYTAVVLIRTITNRHIPILITKLKDDYKLQIRFEETQGNTEVTIISLR